MAERTVVLVGSRLDTRILMKGTTLLTGSLGVRSNVDSGDTK